MLGCTHVPVGGAGVAAARRNVVPGPQSGPKIAGNKDNRATINDHKQHGRGLRGCRISDRKGGPN